MTLSVSISLVSFGSSIPEIANALAIVSHIRSSFFLSSVHLFFIEHKCRDSKEIDDLTVLIANLGCTYEIIYDPTNPGFGAGHNVAVNSNAKYHFILNPDVYINQVGVMRAIHFMDTNPCCGLLSPYAIWPTGQVQPLCKNYPTVFDLFLRGFAPCAIKRLFYERLSHYEMSDTLSDKDIYWDPPIVSGCFMLFRTEVLKQIGGFDPRFFLYFEDFDISLRTAKVSRIAYVPEVKVVHHGGHASRKGWKHIKMFGRSMITFFNIHGWRWW